MARAIWSVPWLVLMLRFNEAWRELRNARNGAREDNYRTLHTHHGYDRNQPRVPKGHPDGGQWSDTGRGGNASEILSDATPDKEWSPGSQYANNRGRGSVPIRSVVNGSRQLPAKRLNSPLYGPTTIT